MKTFGVFLGGVFSAGNDVRKIKLSLARIHQKEDRIMATLQDIQDAITHF